MPRDAYQERRFINARYGERGLFCRRYNYTARHENTRGHKRALKKARASRVLARRVDTPLSIRVSLYYL
jgi:hypothetical protein